MAIKKGTAFADTLFGTSLADQIFGYDGNDTLRGLGGNDTIFGGAGADNMYGGDGNDTVHGGIGNDNLVGDSGNDTLLGQAGVNSYQGGTGHDLLMGGAQSDNMNGGDGNDRFFLGAGAGVADIVVGGAGRDRVSYADALQGVRVDLSGAILIFGGGAQGDTLSGVEEIVGSRYSDVLAPPPGGTAFGGGGSDIMSSAQGLFDILVGDDGYDAFIGLPGDQDAFRLQFGKGFDRIASFGAEDFLILSRAEFNLSGAAGQPLSAQAFFQLDVGPHTGFALGGPSCRLYYDTASGMLWADKDGSGALHAEVPIAQLARAPSLSAAQFLIIA